MAETIIVAPIEGAWCVQRGMCEPWHFHSGEQAEWAARRLGEALAQGGVPTEIRVLGADGTVARRLVFARAEEALTEVQPVG